MNTRTLHNQTGISLRTTLFINEGTSPDKLYGTVNVTLEPGDVKSVSYGDLRNCFLAGLRLSTLPYDYKDTYYCRVVERGDDTDVWLNETDTIELEITRLKAINPFSPFEMEK